MLFKFLLALVTIVQLVVSQSVDKDKCKDYVIINVRGTLEPPGISLQFQPLIDEILNRVPNGDVYSVKYEAGIDQNTTRGVEDLNDYINEQSTKCPNQTFILMGYSQGATVVIESINGNDFDKYLDDVKKVILFGNPYRNIGQNSNVDNDTKGILTLIDGEKNINHKWDDSNKVKDYCVENDCVCNIACQGNRRGHLTYKNNDEIRSSVTNEIVNVMQ